MPSIAARIGLVRLALLAAAGVAALVGFGLMAGGPSVRERDRAQHVVSLAAAGSAPANATASAGVTDSEASQAYPESRSNVHHPLARAPKTNAASVTSSPAPGAPSDAEVRRELKQQGTGVAGTKAVLLSNGQAVAPLGAPDAVRRVIEGGNAIANFPYIWGGGHGSFIDNGYDCSGSVSYALANGGLLKSPMVSGAFASWGAPGAGKWITIYASGGHVYMYVAGLRFDTSGRSGPRGSRWQRAVRSNAGFTAVHPPGL